MLLTIKYQGKEIVNFIIYLLQIIKYGHLKNVFLVVNPIVPFSFEFK